MDERSELLFTPYSEIEEQLTFIELVSDDELGIEEVEQKFYNIRSRIDAHVTVIGKPSGNTYVFPNAGSIVEVAEEDIPFLLAKRLGGKSCCGGGSPEGNVMFEIVA